MDTSSKDDWLNDKAGDLTESVVEDVPTKGRSVRVRGLSAAYSNQAASEALEVLTGEGGRQVAKVNSAKAEVIQFAHGVIEPQFSVAEAEKIAKKFGPAFKRVVAKIDELSGTDIETSESVDATFPDPPASPDGSAVAATNGSGNSRPVVPVRAGA